MIEVFCTNVENQKDADLLLGELNMQFPNYKINFDLEDCDNILRVASDLDHLAVNHIIELMDEFGFTAMVLADSCIGDDIIPETDKSIAADDLIYHPDHVHGNILQRTKE